MDGQEHVFEKSQLGIGQRSITTQILIDRLKQLAVNQAITYQELSSIVGMNVQAEARHYLWRARLRVMRDEGIVLDCIIDVGLKRLPQDDVVRTSRRGIDKIRRTTRREKERIICGTQDFEKLPNDLKIMHNTNLSILQAVAHFGKAKTVKRLIVNYTQSLERLPLAKTLEYCK